MVRCARLQEGVRSLPFIKDPKLSHAQRRMTVTKCEGNAGNMQFPIQCLLHRCLWSLLQLYDNISLCPAMVVLSVCDYGVAHRSHDWLLPGPVAAACVRSLLPPLGTSCALAASVVALSPQ